MKNSILIIALVFVASGCIQTEEKAEHKAMYWEFISQGGKQAVRKGKWKLVKLDVLDPGKTRVELYDLENDRAEQNNVSEAYPEVLAEVEKLLETERIESEHFTLRRNSGMSWWAKLPLSGIFWPVTK